MKDAIKKVRIISGLIFVVQLTAIVVFCISYLNNLFGITNNVSLPFVLSVFIVLIFINIVWCWSTIIYLSKSSKKTELNVAKLIGQDVSEAYNFGMIGLVVVDENFNVMWVNDLFNERQIDLLNENILEWQPDLKVLSDDDAPEFIKIIANTRTYEVKFLKDAGLYIFKDITDLETITNFSKRQTTVVGQIVIDNYSDIVNNEDDKNFINTTVRNMIFNYCKEFDILVKRLSGDIYFLLCNYESLCKIKEDKFKIIDDVRNAGEGLVNTPTISIGLAYDFPDVEKLNEMAENCIEICMSRGGDQAIVSQYGEELQFFGGKTIAQETHNKVRVRVMADSVISLIENSSNVIIMGHTMMDMDALGACLGVKALCDYCDKEALIVYEPKKIERKARGAITSSFSKDEISFFVNETKALSELRSNTLVIVCDVHKPSMTMSPKIISKATKIMVIDHHRRGEEFIESPIYANIDPSASSTCEIIAELIYYASKNPRIKLPSSYATIMLSGIFLDSNFFKSTTSGAKTFEASMILKDFGADNALADDFLKDEFEEYALVNKIISTMKTPYFGIVYCVADEDDIIEQSALAKVANQCMEMKGVNACFVIGRTGSDEVRISCRSDGTINVQKLAEKLNGGGHFTQAAGAFLKLTISQVEAKLLFCLEDYLDDARVGGEN